MSEEEEIEKRIGKEILSEIRRVEVKEVSGTLELIDNYFKDKPSWYKLSKTEARELFSILIEATEK